MGLRAKFNLAMLAAFTLGMIGAGFVSYEVLQRNAREEILHTAGIIMESASATRRYTAKEIQPLLKVYLKHKFIPQTVPAYAATTSLNILREKYPEYTYKEATLNPTNPVSRATDWETTIVEYFRNHTEKKQLVGDHLTATGPELYLARPIQIRDPGCLTCHGKVADAPATMLARYGKSNGFGWKLSEIVGSQIVSVPMSIPLERATRTFYTFMISLATVLIGVFVILNLLLEIIVIKPVKNLSSVAHDVSMGKIDVVESEVRGKDEIASLTTSFNRMRRSLTNAIDMLNE